MAKGMRGVAAWVVLTAAVSSLSARAEPPAPRVLPHSAHGLFTGEQWRYGKQPLLSGLALRIVADLVAIPSGAPWWGADDWLLFGSAAGSTAALSLGTPSIDVRFHQLVQYQLLGGPEHFKVLNRVSDLIIWGSVGAATLSLFIYGLVSGHEASTQTAILMTEAFAVAQLYHNMLKLLAGRAGPRLPELQGEYFGPARGAEFWPAGTPSGHMASMYSMLAVLMYTVDHPAAWVGLNAFALVFGAALVGDNYHWLSDVTLGAALGFCVGRWVMQHRSTRYVYGEDRPPLVRLSPAPLVLPGAGVGLGIFGSF